MFEQGKVCGVVLGELSEEDLKKIGLVRVGDRLKVIAAVKSLSIAPHGTRMMLDDPMSEDLDADGEQLEQVRALRSRQEQLGEELGQRLKISVELMASPALQKLPPAERREKLRPIGKLVEMVMNLEELPDTTVATLAPLLKNAHEMLSLHEQMMHEEERIQEVQSRQEITRQQLAEANGGRMPTKRLMDLKRLQKQVLKADISEMEVLSGEIRDILADTADFTEQEFEVLRELVEMLQEKRVRLERQQRQMMGDMAAQDGHTAPKRASPKAESSAGEKLAALLRHIEEESFTKLSVESQSKALRLALDIISELSAEEQHRHMGLVNRLIQCVEQRSKVTLGGEAQEAASAPTGLDKTITLIKAMTRDLASPAYSKLPAEERLHLVYSGFKMAEQLPDIVLSSRPDVVKEFYTVLKKRQEEFDEMAAGAQEEQEKEEEEGDDEDDEGDEEEEDEEEEEDPDDPRTKELQSIQEQLGKELTQQLMAAVEAMSSPILQKLPILERRKRLQECAKMCSAVLDAAQALPREISDPLLPLLKDAQDMLTLHNQMMDEEAKIQEVQSGGTRLEELKSLQRRLAEAGASDLEGLSVEVGNVLGNTDDLTGEELEVIRELLTGLKERNEAVRAREAAQAESREQETSPRRLLVRLVDQISSDGFMKMPEEDQQVLLRLALDTVNSMPEKHVAGMAEVVKKLVKWVEQRSLDLRQGQKSTRDSAAGSPARSPKRTPPSPPKEVQDIRAVSNLTLQLQSPDFDKLPSTEQMDLIMLGFKIAEEMGELDHDSLNAIDVEVRRDFLRVLKQRQAELILKAAEEDLSDEEDEDVPVASAYSLVGVKNRLADEDFAATTSKSELEAITWVLSESGSEVWNPPERFLQIVKPLHELFSRRLKEVNDMDVAIPLSRGMPFGVLCVHQVGQDEFEIRATAGEPELSAVPSKTKPKGAAASSCPVRAVLMGVGEGTEALEMKRLGSVLEEKLDIKSKVFVDPFEVDSPEFREAISTEADPSRLLVYFRGSSKADPVGKVSDSIFALLPDSAVCIRDTGDVWTLRSPASGDSTLQLRLADEKAREALQPENGMLFGNTLTVVFTQLMLNKAEAPRSASELAREMILCVTASGPQLAGSSNCSAPFDAIPIAPSSRSPRSSSPRSSSPRSLLLDP